MHGKLLNSLNILKQHEIPFTNHLPENFNLIFLRDLFEDKIQLEGKVMVIYILGTIFLLILLLLSIITVLVVKFDYLLYKESMIINGIFKGLGQILVLNNFILFIPSLIILENSIRCNKTQETQYENKCFDNQHISLMIFAMAASLAQLILVVYNNLFMNSQFPSDNIPYACWDGKPLVMKSIWKFIYIFHYDVLDVKYYSTIRGAAFAIYTYGLMLRMAQPKIYNKSVHIFVVLKESIIFTILLFLLLQDILSISILIELFPVMGIWSLCMGGILLQKQNNQFKELLSKDNQNLHEFHHEEQMQMYITLLLVELTKLKSLEKGQAYSSEPQVFTILSRHMEYCRVEECICKKYEPEYDKKFSSVGSRRLTMRQSTSFSSGEFMFKKKLPIKISYETKVQIYSSEISDCIERFLLERPKSVGLKQLKSFYNHFFANSSYKALFVQLENSHSCKQFRGKIGIYHLKTRIQEEMTQSDASPFSIDITTCLKFEAKRVVFEQAIIDLCMVCEGFWNELAQTQKEYNATKVDSLVLEIAKTIINIKEIFQTLLSYNPSGIDAIQSYALIYRYILRDEYRFNDIITSLNQLKKTNKLEQTRELISKFFDSDNYAMILVSGDLKEIGRIVKCNRGVEHIFGYMPNELQGSKINKVMPKLFSSIHDMHIQNFLKRGHSSFIDKNQYLLIENKLRFIQMSLGYVKVMVSLKLGLMFVSFFKFPLKVPSSSEGTHQIKAKDAHFILCDGKGFIHGMSNNCMKNLGIPPTILSRSKNMLDPSNLFHIEQFSKGILGPEFEFDLPKGTNFIFDTTQFKKDKYLQKEFHELTGRMRKYNVFVSLKKFEYKISPSYIQEILLFTMEIISFQLSEAPIIIKVDPEDETTYSHYSGTTVSSVNNDELRTSKFKEFKVQVQDVKTPSKISILKKITILFFFLLLGVFSLNYGLCAAQNKNYIQRLDVLDLLQDLSDKIPSTTRYIRTVINIANKIEKNSNEIISDRFTFYMTLIAENAAQFTSIQEDIYTQYKTLLSLDSYTVTLYNLQTDLTIQQLQNSLSSALNTFQSKALQFSTYSNITLQGIQVPYLSFNFTQNLTANQVSQIQQDLYFLLTNGNQAFPQGLSDLINETKNKLSKQSSTFVTITMIIAIVSIFFNFIIVPLVYPLLIHYERITYLILHAFNRLTKKFIENEIKSCNELFLYVGKKHGSGHNDKKGAVMLKKPEGRKENKELMRVNPKIPKVVQDRKKKINNKGKKRLTLKRSEKDVLNEEEEKQLMIKVERLDQGYEGEEYIDDEQLDEEEVIKVKRSKNPRNSRKRLTDYNAQSNGSGIIQQNTASIASIDESTVRTSVDNNSSTNKSSAEEKSDEDSEDSTSQSNYTQYTNYSQWKAMKSNYGQMKSNISFAYDITHAKSSELQGELAEKDPKAEISEEEKDLKKQIRERQQKIKDELKRRKCIKVLFLVLLIILISVYLGVNTMYTRFVYMYENHLQDDLDIIDNRQLCYTFSLTILKETIARNSSIVQQFFGPSPLMYDIDRTALSKCYNSEEKYLELLLGSRKVNGQMVLVEEFNVINTQLEKDQFCGTIYNEIQLLNSTYNGMITQQICSTVYNNLMEMGVSDVLNFILRKQETFLLQFNLTQKTGNITALKSILSDNFMNEIETTKDIFIDQAFQFLRSNFMSQIKAFVKKLFQIFDILYSVFIIVCFMIVALGVFYYINKLQKRTIQIYHIILLIPYGERTKRELNELLKIKL